MQTDSRIPGQALRMCFSSTSAMAVKYLRPEALLGPNADDDFLRQVQRHGDTTDVAAQIAACADYAVVARFATNGNSLLLQREIQAGFPVATGFLHHGSSQHPWGGGHWILLVGYEPGRGLFNDPYGELDNINGGYVQVGSGGKGVAYSWRHWLPRWQVEGPDTGWYLTYRRRDGLPPGSPG